MTRSLLIRGMIIGACAGLLAFAFARVFGEPQIQHAIDFESYLARLHHEPEGPELVSRGVQRSFGLLTGTLFMGVALGGIFSLTYAWAYGRIGNMSPRLTSLVLAAAAYLTIVLVPFAKYPANPPAISNPDTISKRTLLYFTMITISILAAIAARRIWRAGIMRLGMWNATLVAAAAFLVVIGAAELILPRILETPQGFPADVLYRFRLASLGISLTLWTTIGLGFGAAADRLLAPAVRRAAEPDSTAAPVG
ncbi:CbtA family protein [Baekduia soli]|uniref:CbtA family protein n=1 Tax=Baekduia soli TaxID=496014 RepID=A0A5B8U217_9ACTN|nr:CbtA family protein [Baekduia soli]QEC47037.1 CbtA family protein [Baekduia soli]